MEHEPIQVVSAADMANVIKDKLPIGKFVSADKDLSPDKQCFIACENRLGKQDIEIHHTMADAINSLSTF